MDEPKITSVEKSERVKDPKRVEAGRRLGALSKQAKEKKAQERAEQAALAEQSESKDCWSLYLTVGLVGAAVTVARLYYSNMTKPTTLSERSERTAFKKRIKFRLVRLKKKNLYAIINKNKVCQVSIWKISRKTSTKLL